MPNTPPRRTPRAVAPSDVIDYTEAPDLKPKPIRKASTTKDVPVGKIVSTTLERRLAATLSKATSMSMLNTVGENVAITANEAFNIWHPISRMVGRRIPDFALKTSLSKPDADDVETIILTLVEYFARIVDGAFTRMYNRRIAGIGKQPTMTQPTSRTMPEIREHYRQEAIKEYGQELHDEAEQAVEQFEDVTTGNNDPDIAPMKNGNGSISDLIDRGYIPTDMGETVA